MFFRLFRGFSWKTFERNRTQSCLGHHKNRHKIPRRTVHVRSLGAIGQKWLGFKSNKPAQKCYWKSPDSYKWQCGILAVRGNLHRKKSAPRNSAYLYSNYFIFQDINLDDFETIEKLEELGSERLCELLMLRGLKTGGSTNERADRLLKVKGLERAEYPAELCAPR